MRESKGSNLVIQNVTEGVYAHDGMDYRWTKCAACGKIFKKYSGWIYKKGSDKSGRIKYYCSYHCWPASGLLNEKTYGREREDI